jgi:hypothetical protein
MPRSSWVYKGQPTKIPPSARTPGEPPADHAAPPHTRAAQASKAGGPRPSLWSGADDAVLIEYAIEGRPIAELCAALPHRSERQVIARTRQLRVARRIGREAADALIDSRDGAQKAAAYGNAADPVKVARFWMRAGACADVIAGHLRKSCPQPHGWPAPAVDAVISRTGLAVIDVRKRDLGAQKLS